MVVIKKQEKNAQCKYNSRYGIYKCFLGINHSLAHKIGAEFHLPHGRINAILLPYVIRYNSQMPTKFVSFPKYEYFIADQKYADLSRRMNFPAYTNEEGVNSLIENKKVK